MFFLTHISLHSPFLCTVSLFVKKQNLHTADIETTPNKAMMLIRNPRNRTIIPVTTPVIYSQQDVYSHDSLQWARGTLRVTLPPLPHPQSGRIILLSSIRGCLNLGWIWFLIPTYPQRSFDTFPIPFFYNLPGVYVVTDGRCPIPFPRNPFLHAVKYRSNLHCHY